MGANKTGRLDGMRAVITGASSGSAKPARLFAAEGARVALVARRQDLAPIARAIGRRRWPCPPMSPIRTR
jgi:NADP-dependent 3-hydroxy acid dehydrogenase YdfG